MPLGLIGIIFLAIAGTLALWRRRRVFIRTNEYGVERFPSFGVKIRARLAEGAAGYFTVAFAVGGILLLAVEYQDSWGWIVLLPVLALALLLVV